jgi:hypothetical protein
MQVLWVPDLLLARGASFLQQVDYSFKSRGAIFVKFCAAYCG